MCFKKNNIIPTLVGPAASSTTYRGNATGALGHVKMLLERCDFLVSVRSFYNQFTIYRFSKSCLIRNHLAIITFNTSSKISCKIIAFLLTTQ